LELGLLAAAGQADRFTIQDMLDWELSFYKCIAKGISVSSAFDTAASNSKAPMLLLTKKDLAFAGRATS
jgi:hypothetical protein